MLYMLNYLWLILFVLLDILFAFQFTRFKQKNKQVFFEAVFAILTHAATFSFLLKRPFWVMTALSFAIFFLTIRVILFVLYLRYRINRLRKK